MIFRFPLLFSFILLEVAVKMQMSQHKPADAGSYIEKEDLVYLLSNIPVSLHEVCGNKAEPMKKQVLMLDESYLYVRFEPKYLDFYERYLGIPYEMKVTIVNVHQNRTLHLQSISGSTLDFCSSFFEDKIIPPSENTTFNVVLLGREEGDIETNLYIHTSEGIFKFKVRGSILPNPYRVRPVLSRLPLNASFSPSLSLYNPFPSPLQLLEVLSSGDEGVGLQLPGGGALPVPATEWFVAPYTSKPVLRLSYTATESRNHTSYIRLKVNNSDEVLVVPIGIEVGAQPGLYAEEDIIDLGVGGSLDPSTRVKLYLKNSNKKAIKILGIVPVPTTEVLTVDFDPIKVPPDTEEPFHVATLTYNWAAAHRHRKCCGTILVRTQTQGRLVIPFTAKVLEGGLSYDPAVTKFKTTEGAQKTRFSPRGFMVSNGFRFPLVITSVNLHADAAMYFEISNFQPIVMQPKENRTLFTLQFKQSVVLPRNNFPTSLSVQTNVSTVVIQLFCYSGRLTKITQAGDPIDLGLLGSDAHARKDTHVAFLNENPVPILLTTWGTNLTNIGLEFLGTEQGNASSFLSKLHAFHNLTKAMSVLPGHYAVLRVSVFTTHIGESRPEEGGGIHSGGTPRSGEGVQYGSVWLKTDYERATLSLKMTLARGGLDILPDPVYIKHCFPGKICREALRVGSRFDTPMSVLSVTPVQHNAHFAFEKKEGAVIAPAASNTIGNLTYYLPDLHFLGIHTDDRGEKGGIKWIDTLSLPANTRDFDLENLKHQNADFKQLLLRRINLTLRLETSAVCGHLFRSSVVLSRASVVPRDRAVHFPLTQIGNTSYRNLTLVNPFEKHSLKVQLVLDKHYPGAGTIVSEIPDSLKPPCSLGECHFTSPGEFGFEKIHQDSHVLSSPIHSVHKDTPFYELEPGENVTLNLAFAPSLSQKSTALLFIRNDKTVLETVLLSGIGALVQFDFANRKPGSSTPITFSYERKHVDECENNYRSMMQSKASSGGKAPSKRPRKSPLDHLTIMRSFSARNTGELPIDVFGFAINGLKCQGYGFKVLNCRNFTLTPNSSRKIDISFTPDLSLTKVSRVLTIDTSMAPRGSASYTLEVSLSLELLEACGPLLARPAYEAHIFWTLFLAMSLVFLAVVTSSYLDARHLAASSSSHVCMVLDESGHMQSVLDLRKIGSGVGLSGKAAPPSSSSPATASDLQPPPSKPSPPLSSPSSLPSTTASSSSSWSRFRRVASGVTSGYFASPPATESVGPATAASSLSATAGLSKPSSCLSPKDKPSAKSSTPSSPPPLYSDSAYLASCAAPSSKPAAGGVVNGGGGGVCRKRHLVANSKRGGGASGGAEEGLSNGGGSLAAEEGKKERDGGVSSAWTTLLTKSHNKSSPSPSPPAPSSTSPSPSSLNHQSSSSSSVPPSSSSLNNTKAKPSVNRQTIINNHKLLNYIKKTSENAHASKRNLIDYVSNPTKSNHKKFNGKQNNKESNHGNQSKKEERTQETNSMEKSPLEELIMQDSFSSDDGKSSPSSLDNQKDKENTPGGGNHSPIDHNPGLTPVASETSAAKQASKSKKALKGDVFTNNNIFDAKLLSKGNKKAKETSKLKKAPNDPKPPLMKCKSSPVPVTEDKQSNLDRSPPVLNNAQPCLVTQDDGKMGKLNNSAHNNLSPLPSLMEHRPLYGSSLLDGMLSVRNFMSESQTQPARLNDSFRELGDSPVGSPPSHRPLAPIGTPAPARLTQPEWGHWASGMPAQQDGFLFSASQPADVTDTQTSSLKRSYDNSASGLTSAGWNSTLGGNGLMPDNAATSFLQQHNVNQFASQSAYEDAWPGATQTASLWDPAPLFPPSSSSSAPPTTPLAPLWPTSDHVWTAPPLWNCPPPAPPPLTSGPPPGFPELSSLVAPRPRPRPPAPPAVVDTSSPPPPLPPATAADLQATGQNYELFRRIWDPPSGDIWKHYSANNE